MKFKFMKEHSKELPIEKMAQIFDVCRSGYYKYENRKPSKREEENRQLTEKIKEAYQEGRGKYGSPRVHKVLQNKGELCSRKRVAKLMQKEGLQSKIRKKWTKTTQRDPLGIAAPNLLDQNFTVEEPNKAWVSDISYVETQEGWLYVSMTMDLFSRQVVGLNMGKSLGTSLVTKTLQQALFRRDIKEGLMHHSDRGCQYTSGEFKELMQRHGICLSMSAKGNCYDNAVAESFFHTLKTEHTNHFKFTTREEAKSSIFEYIEVFYNRKRLHSTLGYMSPQEYEKLFMKRGLEKKYG